MTQVNPSFTGMLPTSHGVSYNPAAFPTNQNQFQTSADHLINKQLINNENAVPTPSISAKIEKPTNQNPTPVQPMPIEDKGSVGLPLAAAKLEDKMETETTTPSRDFVDPLTFVFEQLETNYITRESNQTGMKCIVCCIHCNSFYFAELIRIAKCGHSATRNLLALFNGKQSF